MERRGHATSVQGGGSGEGFVDPLQVSAENEQQRRRIRDDIMMHADGAIFREEVFDGTGNNDSNIWRTQLQNQLSSFISGPTGETGPQVQLGVQVEALRHLQGPEPEPVDDQAEISPVIGPSTMVEISPLTGKSTREEVPMRQEIPRLALSAKDAVQLWTNGSSARGFRPVKMYESSKTRKEIIKGYSDRKWKSSGQKRAFQRFKRVIREILEPGYDIGMSDIPENIWDKSIKAFEEKWDRNGKCMPLSMIEKQLNK